MVTALDDVPALQRNKAGWVGATEEGMQSKAKNKRQARRGLTGEDEEGGSEIRSAGSSSSLHQMGGHHHQRQQRRKENQEVVTKLTCAAGCSGGRRGENGRRLGFRALGRRRGGWGLGGGHGRGFEGRKEWREWLGGPQGRCGGRCARQVMGERRTRTGEEDDTL